MANKIVQLVDANDDNIFPLSSDPNAAHITMTNTDPGEGAALGQNEFVAVYGGDPIIMDYSTNEINTGAKWIDGSPIYKKTIDFGALPNNTTKLVAHGISNFLRLIRLEGITYTSAGVYTSVPFVPSSPNSLCDCSVDSTNIRMQSLDNRSGWTAYVTLYYIKSS